MEFEKKELPETFSHMRGPLLERLSHLAYYQHTRALYEQIQREKEKLAEVTNTPPQFKNPREEADFLHRQKTFQVLTQQEKRLKTKLEELQKRIREDIDTFEKVTNTQ